MAATHQHRNRVSPSRCHTAAYPARYSVQKQNGVVSFERAPTDVVLTGDQPHQKAQKDEKYPNHCLMQFYHRKAKAKGLCQSQSKEKDSPRKIKPDVHCDSFDIKMNVVDEMEWMDGIHRG